MPLSNDDETLSQRSETCAAAIEQESFTAARICAIVAGPAVALCLWIFLSREMCAQYSVQHNGIVVVGLLAWMAIWWGTQAVDLAVTGLLPVIVLPITGATTIEGSFAPYANDVIFLFAGGTVIGLAVERHGLGERFLRAMTARVGESPRSIIATFLCVTACISAWISNTASAAMMLPLAAAAAGYFAAAQDNSPQQRKALSNFQCALLLAIAYGASIGGVITLIGSPPNAIAAEWIDANGQSMGFLRWASLGLPTAVLMIAAVLVVFRFTFPLHDLARPVRAHAHATRQQPMSRAAKLTLLIFLCAVLLWVGTPILKMLMPSMQLNDGMIAIAAAIALFILPANRGKVEPIVPWSQSQRLPWGVFILFGGGLSLAAAMQKTGVSSAIAQSLGGLAGIPEVVVVLVIVSVLVFASEIGSNTALTATAVPIVGALAPGLGIAPEKLVVAAALGASCAFMLPVGTPPNAIVFSTGLVPQREMIRSGFALNICSIVVITLVCTFLF